MAWSAQQYLKFENERTRPARDLLAQVPLETAQRAIDLGCGPGNSTELLVERFGAGNVSGIDSDADMLEKARSRLPGTPFVMADVATWRPVEKADLFFANAVFQWLPDHMPVLEKLMDSLNPGGVLAVQMPDNLAEPSHAAMEETGADGPWADILADGKLRRAPLPSPADYIDALGARASRIDVWHTLYYHPMEGPEAIVEWVKGTGLRPYLQAVGPQHETAFLDKYRDRMDRYYPPMADGRRLLAYPRLFVVAIKA